MHANSPQLEEWCKVRNTKSRSTLLLEHGGAIQIEERKANYNVIFYTYNGKKKNVELELDPNEYEITDIREGNRFIEIMVVNEQKNLIIFFEASGNFVAMGPEELFELRNGNVFINFKCGSLKSKIPLWKCQ